MPQLAVGMAGPRRFAALFALSELTNLVYLCYFFDARAKPIVVRHLQEALAALGTGVTSNAAVRGAFWASVLWDVAFFAAGVGSCAGGRGLWRYSEPSRRSPFPALRCSRCSWTSRQTH
jgi:hypothetical protein